MSRRMADGLTTDSLKVQLGPRHDRRGSYEERCRRHVAGHGHFREIETLDAADRDRVTHTVQRYAGGQKHALGVVSAGKGLL